MNNGSNLKCLKRGLTLTVIITLFAAVLLGAFQTVIMLTSYEFEQQLYFRDAPLPVIMTAALIAVTLLCTAATALTSKGKQFPSQPPKIGAAASFFAAVTAFLIFGCFVNDFISVFVTGSAFVTGAQNTLPVQRLFHYAKVVFAIPAGTYYLTLALGRTPRRNPAMLLGFGAVMWSAMHLITTYFNMSLPINSPPHVLKQLAFAALMLSQLYSLRFIIGTQKVPQWICLSLIGTVFGAVSSFAPLVLTAFGYYRLSGDTLIFGAQLALTFYTAVRCYEYCIAAALETSTGEVPNEAENAE